MLLIGFTWLFIGVLIGLGVRLFLPGRWEQTGPAAMMATVLGSFMGGMLASLAFNVPDLMNPDSPGIWIAVLLSIAGGVAAFAVYLSLLRRPIRL